MSPKAADEATIPARGTARRGTLERTNSEPTDDDEVGSKTCDRVSKFGIIMRDTDSLDGQESCAASPFHLQSLA